MATNETTRVFDSLEKKVEKLLGRLRALAEENRDLQERARVQQAELDRMKEALAAARQAGQKGEQLAAEIARYEEERTELRGRVARLIETLESVDVAQT
jgi:chromosome segregation ATPase